MRTKTLLPRCPFGNMPAFSCPWWIPRLAAALLVCLLLAAGTRATAADTAAETTAAAAATPTPTPAVAATVTPEATPEARTGGAAGAAALPPLRDPLKPLNVAFYHFNDKLYFWVLKPLAQGYSYVVPEKGRIGVRNFFTNIAMPVRFVNCVLQVEPQAAGAELNRFFINTTVGVLGFADPALNKWQIKAHDEDFGKTLGYYGARPAIYLHWPLFGPSNPRDTVGLVADSFLDPFGYLLELPPRVGVKAGDRVNRTSLQIGDYEDLKEAAIDPYVSVRDAYHQYREKQIRAKTAASGQPENRPPDAGH